MTLTYRPSRCALHRARGKPPPPDTLFKKILREATRRVRQRGRKRCPRRDLATRFWLPAIPEILAGMPPSQARVVPYPAIRKPLIDGFGRPTENASDVPVGRAHRHDDDRSHRSQKPETGGRLTRLLPQAFQSLLPPPLQHCR